MKRNNKIGSNNYFLSVGQNREFIQQTFKLFFYLNNRNIFLNDIVIFFTHIPVNFYDYKISEFIQLLLPKYVRSYFNNQIKNRFLIELKEWDNRMSMFFIVDKTNKVRLGDITVVPGYKRIINLLNNASVLLQEVDYTLVISALHKGIYRPFVINIDYYLKNVENTDIKEQIIVHLKEYYEFIITLFYILCEIYDIKYSESVVFTIEHSFIEKVYTYYSSGGKSGIFNFVKYCYGFYVNNHNIKNLILQLEEKLNKQDATSLSYIGKILKGFFERYKIHKFIIALEKCVNLDATQVESVFKIKSDNVNSLVNIDDKSLGSKLINKFTNYICVARFNKTSKTLNAINAHMLQFLEYLFTREKFVNYVNLLILKFKKLKNIANNSISETIINPKVKPKPHLFYSSIISKCTNYQLEIIEKVNYSYYGFFLEMGLGKTFVSIVEMVKYFHNVDFYFLILPVQLEDYWKKEIKKHQVDFLLQKIIFIKYSTLSVSNTGYILELYLKYENSNLMFVLDESTYVKSASSTRSENIQFLLLLFRTRIKYCTIIRLLTGTPYSNHAYQIRGQMILLNPYVVPNIKTFEILCKQSLMLEKKGSNTVSFYDTIILISNQYLENMKNTTNFQLSISKVYEVMYVLKSFFNNYFICLDKKSLGLNVEICTNLITINNVQHIECLEYLSHAYSKNLKEEIMSAFSEQKEKEKDNVHYNDKKTLEKLINKRSKYLRNKYFMPLYFFACGGVTASVTEYIQQKGLDILKYTDSTICRIRDVINYILNKTNKFIYVSLCSNALINIKKVLEELNLNYKAITSNTNIKQRQLIIDEYNNNKFDILLSSVYCIAYGFSIYATNIILMNEPIIQIEIYEQLKNRIIRLDSSFKKVEIYVACTSKLHFSIFNALTYKQSIIDIFNNAAKKIISV